MKRVVKVLTALCLASLTYAIAYVIMTGWTSFLTGVMPLTVVVAAASVVTYLPAKILWDSRVPSTTALRSIALAVCLSATFLLGFLMIEYYGARITKATETINGGTRFIAGAPTDFWYRSSIWSIVSAVVAAMIAGFVFWYVCDKRKRDF